MAANDNLGDLTVSVTGDFSELISALTEATQAITKFADQASSSLSDVEKASHATEGAVAGMAEQFSALAEALVVTEGLKEFGKEALKAYGTVQSVTIGLTQLTKSAQSADEIITQVKELAATEPFAFPEIAPTIQKMVALGVSAEQIPGVMHAVADSAAATGNSFQAVANSFDRMALSGTVNARALVQLGVSTTDLGRVMEVSAEQVKTAFAALDQSQRIEVLQGALEKFAGAAEAQAKGIAGQWQIFQNQFEEVMVGVGEAIAPVVSQILGFASTVLTAVQQAETAFEKLPEPVKDVAVVLGLVVAAIAPLAAGMAALGFAITGFNTAWATGAAILKSFSGSAGEAAVAEGVLATAATEATTAETAQVAATEELAAAQTALGSSSAGAASGFRLIADGAAAAAGVFTGWQLGKWVSENIPILSKGLADAGIAAAALTTGNIPALIKVLNDLRDPLIQVGKAMEGTGALASGFGNTVVDVSDKLAKLLDPLTQVQNKQIELNDAVNKSRLALELAKVSLENATAGTQQYSVGLQVLARAQNDYDNAVKAATPHNKDFADSFAGIVQVAGDAQAKLTNAMNVFNQIQKAYDDGKVSALALADAEAKLNAAYAGVNGAIDSHLTGLQKLIEQTGNATQAWIQAKQTLDDAAAAFLRGQVNTNVLTEAVKQAESAAKAAGVAFGDPGSGAAAAVQILGEKAGAAAIIVNGQFVPTMEAAARISQQAHDDWVQCASAADQLGQAVGGASVQVTNFTDAMSAQSTAVAYDKDALDALVDSYYAAANAAAAAADAVNSLAEAENNEGEVSTKSAGGKGGKSGGMSLESWFEDVASAYGVPGSGVTLADLDQFAQLVANQTGATIHTPDETVVPQGTGPTSRGANTDIFGRPLPTSSGSTATPIPSSGGSSGITALMQSAGLAATSVAAMATAASSTATPLGAFVDGLTTLGSSAIPPVVEALSGAQVSAKDFYTAQEKATGTLTASNSKYYDAVAAAINAQNDYTAALISGKGVSDQVYAAWLQTAQALTDLTGQTGALGDATQDATLMLQKTDVQASDFTAALRDGTGAVSSANQKYAQAVADATNAQAAYTNALISGKGVSDEVFAAWLKTAQALTALSGQTGVTGSADPFPNPPSGLIPTEPPPSGPPAGTTGIDAAAGNWQWNGKAWVWNPQAKGASGATGPGLGTYNPNAGIYAPGTGIGTGGLGALNSPSGLTIQVNLTTGPIVGTNAASILTDAMAPQLVAKLRQAGVKL